MLSDLPASYISLMGWDNRRFTSRSPLLGKEQHELRHLTGPVDPRFHLHPALWDAGTLEQCCAIALKGGVKNGSAWHFEKACGRSASGLPGPVESGCYQIRASRLALRPPPPLHAALDAAERFVFHRLMALYPLISNPKLAKLYWEGIGFDNVFCEGPYPMFFSGIMAKGDLNRFFVSFLRKRNPSLLNAILQSMPRR
jgi:hypothetical protein